MQKFPLALGLTGLFFLGRLCAEQLPEMRPALLQHGPGSLVNLIDTQKLMQKGQGDAIVRFSCRVSHIGQGYDMVTYRSSPNSDALAEEAVEKCTSSRFVPAVYGHQKRGVIVSGTIIYGIINGKPHLRIYLNQEEEHLKRGDDFISPQWVYVWEKANLKEFDYPQFGIFSATLGVKLETDAAGRLKSSKVTSEIPAGRGFGVELMKHMGDMTFLPSYERGQPVACTTTYWFLFRGRGHGPHWRTDSN